MKCLLEEKKKGGRGYGFAARPSWYGNKPVCFSMAVMMLCVIFSPWVVLHCVRQASLLSFDTIAVIF